MPARVPSALVTYCRDERVKTKFLLQRSTAETVGLFAVRDMMYNVTWWHTSGVSDERWFSNCEEKNDHSEKIGIQRRRASAAYWYIEVLSDRQLQMSMRREDCNASGW